MIRTGTVVLGAGPAGTGPLVCAIREGRHRALLDRGVVWVDRAPVMSRGSIGGYAISSDTVSDVLLECLARQEDGPLAELLAHDATSEVRTFRGGPLPLAVAGRFYEALGVALQRLVDRHGHESTSPGSAFLPRATALRVERTPDGGWLAQVATEQGTQEIRAKRVLFALGGEQNDETVLGAEIASGLRLRDGFADRTMLTRDLVTEDGQAMMAARLAATSSPRIVIVGSSHSAFTAAWLFVQKIRPGLAAGAVTVLHRREPKLFYPTPDAARADGYTGWDERDVCPVTGRLFRLAGLRLTARDLVRSIRGLGDAPREERIVLDRFDPKSLAEADRLRRTFEQADVIVPAFGYTPRTVPIFRDGARIRLHSEVGARASLVDGECRVLSESGEIVPNVYAMGLASGFVPHGAMGGEPSFDGQTNGLWLYQNDIGRMLLDRMLEA